MPSVGAGFTLFKHYSLKFDLGYSITDNLIQNDNNQKKVLVNALLQINYPRFRLNSRLMYGEPSFAGMQRGKMDWNSYFDLDLKIVVEFMVVIMVLTKYYLTLITLLKI